MRSECRVVAGAFRGRLPERSGGIGPECRIDARSARAFSIAVSFLSPGQLVDDVPVGM